MSGMIWVLIPLAAILGWIIVEYQEYRLKMIDKQNQPGPGREFQEKMDRLEKRIQNLEAIVVDASSEFTADSFNKEKDTGANNEQSHERNKMSSSENKIKN
jgi:hypothetical protein